jgi:hypothetical protein
MSSEPVRSRAIPFNPQTPLLHDAVTCAALGAAVLNTMETVLPSAALVVEKATKELSDRFMTLALHAEAQGEIVQRVIEYATSVGGNPAHLRELTHQSETVSQQIADTICGMIMGLQFQDRNSQIIENAVRILGLFSGLLADLRTRSLMLQSDSLSCSDAMIIAETFLNAIRIGDIRQQFVIELSKADIPLAEYMPKIAPDDETTELF